MEELIAVLNRAPESNRRELATLLADVELHGGRMTPTQATTALGLIVGKIHPKTVYKALSDERQNLKRVTAVGDQQVYVELESFLAYAEGFQPRKEKHEDRNDDGIPGGRSIESLGLTAPTLNVQTVDRRGQSD